MTKEARRPRPKFPQHIRDFIRENNQGRGSAEMAAMLNQEFGTDYRPSQIQAYRKNNHMPCGVDTRFRPGQESPTKGKKWDEYMSPEGQAHSRAACYQKGNRPHNAAPVGTEVFMPDSGYWKIKVAEPNKWQLKQRYIWEQAHGEKVPAGHVVAFLDGDVNNFDPENLVLMTKREVWALNEASHKPGRRSSDPELTQAYLNLFRIKDRLRRIAK